MLIQFLIEKHIFEQIWGKTKGIVLICFQVFELVDICNQTTSHVYRGRTLKATQ